MELLDDFTKSDDTLFIFTSDNGASGVAGFEELAEKGHNPSYHFKGHKSDIWEGGHREPAVVSFPSLIERGRTSKQMVCHSDIFRTIADLLEIQLPDDTAEDSFSLLPLLKGSDTPIREDIVHSSGNGGFSIRRGFWKLIFVKEGGGFDSSYDFYTQPKSEDGEETLLFCPYELNDLRDDISEENNVIEKYPDIVEELQNVLTCYIKEGRSTKEGKAQDTTSPNFPSGKWRQIEWMEESDDFLSHINNRK